MAITRAQQVKQMLREGGRIGLRNGSYDEAGLEVGPAPQTYDSPAQSFKDSVPESSYDAPTGAVDDKFKGPGQSPDYFTTTNTTGYDEETGVTTPPTGTTGGGGNNNVVGGGDGSLQTLYNQGVPESNFPGIIGFGLNFFKDFRDKGLRRNIDYFRELQARGRLQDYPPTAEGYKQYIQDRMSGKITASGNPGSETIGGRDDDEILFSQDMEDNTGGGGDGNDDSEDKDDTNTGGLGFRFMSRGGMPMDAPTTGGIMDLETGRQMYFLGKLVKKATRAVKKIAKSPIGKAALMFGIPGTGFGGLFGRASLGGAAKGLFGKYGIAQTLGMKGLSPGAMGGKKAGLGGLFERVLGFAKDNPILTGGSILALLPFLSEEQKQQLSDRGVNIDPGYIRDNPYTFASQVGGGSGTATAFLAEGGRIGLKDGKTPSFEEYMQGRDKFEKQMNIEKKYREYLEQMRRDKVAEQKTMAADGGRIGYQEGSKEPVAKKTMPLLDMGGKEMDLRDDGGFVPIGRMEKADDVPARLSKNEFVFTADAVRNAGEGDVDKGAEVMYNMMKNLESGGEVSEESQGLEGARKMFQTSKRLEEVL